MMGRKQEYGLVLTGAVGSKEKKRGFIILVSRHTILIVSHTGPVGRASRPHAKQT